MVDQPPWIWDKGVSPETPILMELERFSPPAGLRRRPAVFRALGRREPPTEVETGGRKWKLREVFKHDSWAATALYGGDRDAVVVKFNRTHPILILPMAWLGRWLAARESRAYSLLAGLRGIPASCGEVLVGGHRWPNAFAHHYIPGHPLAKEERPGAGFFDELERLLDAMHNRGLAYLDLNKRENVIVSEDGLPVLVDFQIHFAAGKVCRKFPLMGWITGQLQAGDIYHFKKLKLYHTESPEAVAQLPIPWSSKLWRMLYVHPVQWVRRRLLVALRIRRGEGLAWSELEPEKAVRLAKKTRKGAAP